MSDGDERGTSERLSEPSKAVIEQKPPLLLVKGDATEEEVAALVAVVQGIAAAQAGSPEPKPASQWSANSRKLRTTFPAGPGAWRASALPR